MSSIPRDRSSLPFWQRPVSGAGNLAVIDGRTGDSLTYAGLFDRVDQVVAALGPLRQKKLALLRVGNDLDSLLCYLALLASGHAVWLSPSGRLGASDLALIEQYRPELVIEHPSLVSQLDAAAYPEQKTLAGYRMHIRGGAGEAIHPDLALLLPTSGSTSNPKFARLSYAGIAANAGQIVDALQIHQDERWLASLPLHYVFGLSVIHSVLRAGAAAVLGDRTVMQQSYWALCRTHGVTSLAVVPSQLTVMHDIKLDLSSVGSIRKIAVSGGAMSDAVRAWLAQQVVPAGISVYSMYGMTEASGRIAVLDSDEFAQHPGSVGRAVCGGRLRILPSGEVEYAGANVMMGYATTRTHLGQPDALGGLLKTGDLGRIDAAGRLYLLGRTNRICKLFGVRIDLDDVEILCAAIGPVAALSDDRMIYVFHGHAPAAEVDASMRRLAVHLRMPIVAFAARGIDAIPQTLNGKTHYAALRGLLGG